MTVWEVQIGTVNSIGLTPFTALVTVDNDNNITEFRINGGDNLVVRVDNVHNTDDQSLGYGWNCDNKFDATTNLKFSAKGVILGALTGFRDGDKTVASFWRLYDGQNNYLYLSYDGKEPGPVMTSGFSIYKPPSQHTPDTLIFSCGSVNGDILAEPTPDVTVDLSTSSQTVGEALDAASVTPDKITGQELSWLSSADKTSLITNLNAQINFANVSKSYSLVLKDRPTTGTKLGAGDVLRIYVHANLRVTDFTEANRPDQVKKVFLIRLTWSSSM
jgi:hypothetical protein